MKESKCQMFLQGGQELPTTNCTVNCQSISAEFDIMSASVNHYLIVITV